SRFATPTGRRFHREAIAALAEQDIPRIVTLTLDGRPIAFHYYLAFAGRMYVHRLAFDPELARFSPGLLATLDAIRLAAGAGLHALGEARDAVEQPVELRREVVGVVAPVDHRAAELRQRRSALVHPRPGRHAGAVARVEHGAGLAAAVDAGGIAEARQRVPEPLLEPRLRPGDLLPELCIVERREAPVRPRVRLHVDEAALEHARQVLPA